MPPFRIFVALAPLAAAVFLTTPARAAEGEGVTPASLQTPVATGGAVEPEAGAVTFAARQARPGDRVAQRVQVEMRLTTRTHRGGELLAQAPRISLRQQSRELTLRDAPGGLPRVGVVRYLEAERRVDDAASAEPVAGKTYLLTRTPDALIIVYPSGEVPPPAEHAIVATTMQAFGLANPLGRFLAGRTVRVGERVELPADVAGELLGLDRALGEVERMTLTLRAASGPADAPTAEFDAEVEATQRGASQMRMFVAGRMSVEARTCRAVAVDLAGPVGMSEARLDPGGTVQVDASGKVRVAIASRYTDAP